jgi:hypothetical protein
MVSEQREYTRFLTKNNAYASFGQGAIRVGTIRDISMGGISFEYVFYADSVQEDSHQIDIFITQNGFQLSDLPCEVVYDIPLRVSSTTLFITKRCGLKFGDLSDVQSSQLKIFLENHTTGIVQ